MVTLLDDSGVPIVAYTNQLGYYLFDEVAVGSTFILMAERKGYQFDPLVITANSEMKGLDIMALP